MSRYFFACSLAGALALTAGASAQDPQTPPAPRTPTAQDPGRMQDQARTVTVEGCLMREEDVPGRKPNVAERAGMGEDYVLTSTKIIKGSAPSGAMPGTRPGETPTGTSGARASMYEVEGIDDEELKPLLGQRVQIEGVFENVDQAKDPAESRTPTDDLVELRGTTIRKVSGSCPAK